MRLPRLTIRRLMILVAVAALVLEVASLLRSNAYRRQAELHEKFAAEFRKEIETLEHVGEDPEAVAHGHKLVAEEERQAQRYRDAQRRPWLGVPDEAPAD